MKRKEIIVEISKILTVLILALAPLYFMRSLFDLPDGCVTQKQGIINSIMFAIIWLGYINWLAEIIHKKSPSQWINVEDSKDMKRGEEFLLYNEKWISEYNPKGERIGYLDDVVGWVSTYYCNYHDEYHTRFSDEDDKKFTDFEAKNQIPTHYQPLPQPHKK